MALELIDIHKSYPMHVGRRHVLRGVNAIFRKGERVGILGRNGSGKSTLVRILGGIDAPTRGTIRRTMSVSWPIGLAAGFQPALSGANNARFIARIYDRPVQETVRFVESFAELGDYLNMPVQTYSSGMQVRLAFSVAVAGRPAPRQPRQQRRCGRLSVAVGRHTSDRSSHPGVP